MSDMQIIEKVVSPTNVFRHIHMVATWKSLKGYNVISGGHVTQHAGGAEMSVDVAAISYNLDNVPGSTATVTNVIVEAADATPRIDVLYISAAGVMTIAKGTAHAIEPTGETVWQKYELPAPADVSSIDGTVLAEILVPAGATSILDAYIRELFVSIKIDVTSALTIVTTVGAVGSDSVVPSEQAVREAIPPIVTTVATPGSDAKVPSEQAVREAIPPLVTAITGAGADTNIVSEQGIVEYVAAELATLETHVEGQIPAIVTTIGTPGADDKVPSEQAVREEIAAITGSGEVLWKTFPGTPTRISDTSFSVTDTGNADLYDKKYGPNTIIKWEKSGGGFQAARIDTSAYAADVVTFTIKGNTLAASFTDMKYCIHRCKEDIFILPNTLPFAAQAPSGAKAIVPSEDIYIFSARVQYLTAPTTTGGVWDIFDDGASIFTTKPPIAAAAKLGTETVCDSMLGTATTAVAAYSELILNYVSGHATTPGADAYVHVFYMPVDWRYLT